MNVDKLKMLHIKISHRKYTKLCYQKKIDDDLEIQSKIHCPWNWI